MVAFIRNPNRAPISHAAGQAARDPFRTCVTLILARKLPCLLRASFGALLVLLAAWVPVQASGAEQSPQHRYALLIGNADYDGNGHIETAPQETEAPATHRFLADLDSPLRDVVAIESVLKRQGFEVEVLTNLDRSALIAAMKTFRQRALAAAPDDRLVFYFSGHSVQVEADLYLVPVRAELVIDPRLGRGGMTYRYLKTAVEPLVSLRTLKLPPRPADTSGFNLLILDSCRDNPWPELALRGILNGELQRLAAAGERMKLYGEGGYAPAAGTGWAPYPPRGTFMALAATPGSTALDGTLAASPFTDALVRHWDKANDFRTVFDLAARDVSTVEGAPKPFSYGDPLSRLCLTACPSSDAGGGRDLKVPADAPPTIRNIVAKALKMAAAGRTAAVKGEASARRVPPDRKINHYIGSASGPEPPKPAPRTFNGPYTILWGIEDLQDDTFAGEVSKGKPSGLGEMIFGCAVSFLRARCPLHPYQVFRGEFRHGHIQGLGLYEDLAPAMVDIGSFSGGVESHGLTLPHLELGLRQYPVGVTEVGRFAREVLKQGVRWSDYGARVDVIGDATPH